MQNREWVEKQHLSQLNSSSSLMLQQIPTTATSKIVYDRAKKEPLKWVTEPNVAQSEIFKEEFNSRLKDICCNLQKAEDFFKLIITYEILLKIVENTNSRIELNKIEADRITPNELLVFIGLLILFGQTKKSNDTIQSLWSAESIHWSPLTTAAMTRTRFHLISRQITFDDNRPEIRKSKKLINHKFYKIDEIF